MKQDRKQCLCLYSSLILQPSTFQSAGGNKDMVSGRVLRAAGVSGRRFTKRNLSAEETGNGKRVQGGTPGLGSAPQRRSRSFTCRAVSAGERELSITSPARLTFSVRGIWALARASTSFAVHPRWAATRA